MSPKQVASDIRSGLLGLLRYPVISVRSKLKRVWQFSNHHHLGVPEWLSSRTESLHNIRFRLRRAERVSISEWFHNWLQDQHTIRQCTSLGAVVLAAAVAVSVIYGMVKADREATPEVFALAGTLVTVAEVLASAAGILFAVIVFGIQFHGEKLGKAAFLVRFLRRREGLLPIAAVTLAIVAANVIVSIISALGLRYAAEAMAALDVLLVPLDLWLVLWLLYRMTVSVSEDFVTLLTPSLTRECDLATSLDIHHAQQWKVYNEFVNTAGLKYSSIWELDYTNTVDLGLPGTGCIVDVNLSALSSLGHYLRTACPQHEPTLCLGPRDSVANNIALVLSVLRDEQNQRPHEVESLNDEVVKELRRRLQSIFRLGKDRSNDAAEVLAYLVQLLVGYARYGLSEKLEEVLNIQLPLINTTALSVVMPKFQS